MKNKLLLIAIVIVVAVCAVLPGAFAAEVGPEAVGTWNADAAIGTVNGLPMYGDALHFRVEISAADVSLYQYRLTSAAGTKTEWAAVNNGTDIVLPMEDGRYTLQIRLLDERGKALWTKSCGEAILEKTGVPKDAPNVKVTAGGEAYRGGWTNADVTVRVSGSAAVSGIRGYEYSVDYADPAMTDIPWTEMPGTLTVSADTNAVYRFRAVTNAGNMSQVVEKGIRVQKTAPEAAVVTPSSQPSASGWYTAIPDYAVAAPRSGAYTAPVHCTLTVSVNGKISYNADYDGTRLPPLTTDGKWIIKAVVTDEAGNRSEAETSSLSLQIDTTAPEITKLLANGRSDLLNAPSLLLAKASVITAAAEDRGSGLAGLYYREGDGQWTAYPSAGIPLVRDGTVRYQFRAVDNAGNEATVFSCPVELDTTPAEAEVRFSGTNRSGAGIYFGNVTASYSVRDSGSGIASVSYRVLSGGKPTQSGVLFRGWDAGCSGTVEIQAAKNNGPEVTVELTVIDAAGNRTVYRSAPCVIDTQAPIVEGSYSGAASSGAYMGMEGFRGSRTLVVKVTEPHFDEASSSIVVREEDTGKILPYTWKHEGDVHTAVIVCGADGRYTVSASVSDTVGNKTQRITFAAGTKGANAFVIDTTAPVLSLSYDNNDAMNGIYYASGRTVTLTVRERNFAPAGITGQVVLTTPDGRTESWSFTDWKENEPSHTYTASIRLAQDGVYKISVTGTDVYGNPGNTLADAFCIDMTAPEPFFDFVDPGAAYGGELKPVIRVMDWNIDTVSLRVTRTRKDKRNEDVTEQFCAGLQYEDITGGRQAVLDSFAKEQSLDGVYTLYLTTRDMAGNAAEKEISFSVNRFGSLYVYDSYLNAILGGYHPSIDKNIVITEYNPSGLVAQSPLVALYRNGSLMNDVIYTVTPDADGGEKVGLSGWYEYRYEIDRANFSADGFYGIVISSADKAGNTPENTDAGGEIRFARDTTAPELVSVSGLSQSIINADRLGISITAMDNVELLDVYVYLNGELVLKAQDIGSYGWDGSIEAKEGMDQHLRIVATDRAGNKFDSDIAGSGFCADFTVSTNALVRFYADKTLFYSVLGGTLGLLALLGVCIFFVRKKKAA